jgi:acyl carrier protein
MNIFDPKIHMFDSETLNCCQKPLFFMEIRTVKRNLYRVLRKTGVQKENISLEASFQDDLHFDTTDWTIFTFYLESIFKINVEAESLKNLHCVNDTLNLLRQTA